MADLFYSPVHFGYDDVQIPRAGDSFETSDGATSFAARIYYPSESTNALNAPRRPGPYPLVIFAHGQRERNDGVLCPPDVAQDFRHWQTLLTLMARCGYVVVSPAMHDVFGGSEAGVERLEATARWMYHHWPGRSDVTYPLQSFLELAGPARRLSGFPRETTIIQRLPDALLDLGNDDLTAPIGRTAPLGLIGHSWGIKHCCRMAVRQKFSVSALGGVAGTFDDNEAPADFVRSNVPSFLLCGTADDMTFSYLPGLWSGTPAPKHQAAIRGLGHWDWFGVAGGIQPCDDNADRAACSRGNRIGAVMLLNFVRRYLGGVWYSSPTLLERPSGFPPFNFSDSPCAVHVRWDAPTAEAPAGAQGSNLYGNWDTGAPW